MAYVSSNPDDETQNEGGPLVPGGAPTPSAPSTGATAQPAGQKPKTSGRFADLGEYLRVNAPQQFGSQLAGKVGQDVDTAGNQLGQASDEFKSRADAGTVKDNQGLIGQVGTNPEGIDAGAFSKLRDASYGGPTNFSSASDLYNQTTGQANAAESKANASKTEGGRFALLDSYYGKPQYSQGQKSLDNLLVQNDPNSQQAFKQIQDNARALQSNVAQTGNQLSAYGNQAKATTEATKNSARSALGIDDVGNATGTGAIGDLKGQISNQLTAQQAEANRIQGDITNKTYSDISPDLAKNIKDLGPSYGVDAGNYLSGTLDTSLTPEGVSSPEQQARMKALYHLGDLGDPYSGMTDTGAQYGKNLYDFNSPGYQGAINSNKQDFNTALDKINRQLGSSTSNSTANNGGLLNVYAELKHNIDSGQLSPDDEFTDGEFSIGGKSYTGTATSILSQLNKDVQELNRQKAALYNQYLPSAGGQKVTPTGGGVTGLG